MERDVDGRKVGPMLGARESARGAFGDLDHTIYHGLSLPPPNQSAGQLVL